MAGVALMASVISLFASFGLNAALSPPGNPGVERPVVTADVFTYTFETLALVLAAIGITTVLSSVPFGERRPSGYLAAVFTWVATVFFAFVTLGRREQADLFEAGRTDLLLDGRLPGWEGFYSAGYIFFGVGVALLGWGLSRMRVTHQAMGYVGAILGTALALGAYIRLVFGSTQVTDAGLIPVLLVLIWLFALGVVLYKSGRTAATYNERTGQ